MELFDLFRLAICTPMYEWDEVANRWINSEAGKDYLPTAANRGTMDDAIRQLDTMIVCLSRFREYLDQRYGSGCGDQGHADAVKAQNRVAAKIRKALGYTYAKNDINFTGDARANQAAPVKVVKRRVAK